MHITNFMHRGGDNLGLKQENAEVPSKPQQGRKRITVMHHLPRLPTQSSPKIEATGGASTVVS